MKNRRLEDLASRHKSPGFLEAEAQKAEEARILAEQERLRVQRKLESEQRTAIGSVQDETRRTTLTAYVNKLQGYQGSKLDVAFEAFVTHPDFPIIYNQLVTIESASDKWGFIVRRAHELGDEVKLPMYGEFKYNEVELKRRFEDYGIYMLCPFFRTNEESLTKQECLINGEPNPSTCDGNYETCRLFADKSKRALDGSITLPKIERSPARFQIPKMDVDPVDLDDLEDWWQMEGKYE
ncbi:MAG: hypothetical protein AABX23_04615 [Nanoarchaeota archaeon]